MRRAGLLLLFGVSCLGGSGPGIRDKDDAAAPPTSLDDLDAQKKFDVDLGDPFAILGLNPSHGPWTGGTRTLLSGRGFPSKLRVWIGGVEIDPSAVLASDPTHAAVTTPPAGVPGAADVKIRDDKTAMERTLQAGFFYDAFVVQPDSGATSGGTRVLLNGLGTQWVLGTTVDFGGKPCTSVQVIDATHLECVTPDASPGAVDVTVTVPNQQGLQARDAFTYNDSLDGYRGGLSGGALSGNLKVIALDNWTGFPIDGATVIVGGNIATAKTALANAQGVAQFSDQSLTGKVTVTISQKCHQPQTFVDVPVDTVTAYLDPVFDLSCASGDPPSISGKGKDGGLAQGELRFGQVGEVEKRDWLGVPLPTHPDERRAAYVFVASPYLDNAWHLPDPSQAITEQSPGTLGYGYSIGWYPGNNTIYAVAGIEKNPGDGGTRTFQAYAMGIVRGVPMQPKTLTSGVDIRMDLLLSHAVQIQPTPPPQTYRGPDRIRGKIALTVGSGLYAFLPQDQTFGFLPNPGILTFTGQPPLIGDLTAESYIIGGYCSSGINEQAPASIVQKQKTNNANTPVNLTGFLPVPAPVAPGAATWNGTHVTVQTSGTFDLLDMSIRSGGGLVTWTIHSPANTDFDVPDLALAGTKLGLVKGPIQTSVYVARIENFKWEKVRYGWLYSSGWSAFAYDVANGIY